MGQNCLLDRKEHSVGAVSYPVPGELHADKLRKELSTEGYLILMSTCLCLAPMGQDCSENQFLAPRLPEAVLPHNKTMSRTDRQFHLCAAPRRPRVADLQQLRQLVRELNIVQEVGLVPEAVSSIKKVRYITFTERTAITGWLSLVGGHMAFV